jgi:hypothetical protein
MVSWLWSKIDEPWQLKTNFDLEQPLCVPNIRILVWIYTLKWWKLTRFVLFCLVIPGNSLKLIQIKNCYKITFFLHKKFKCKLVSGKLTSIYQKLLFLVSFGTIWCNFAVKKVESSSIVIGKANGWICVPRQKKKEHAILKSSAQSISVIRNCIIWDT